MTRVLVFDPYLPTLGGGERYIYALVELLECDMEVTLAAAGRPDFHQIQAQAFASRPILEMHPLEFPAASSDYDLAVYLTNSPPPPSYATQSLLVVQFPFEALASDESIRADQLHALDRYNCIVYSDFAREWLVKRWGPVATVVHPPVRLGPSKRGKKERLILSVGRFFSTHHSKRQDVLVDAFRELATHRDFQDWRLVLAGGVADDPDSKSFVDAIRSSTRGLAVDVEENVSSERLAELYGAATFFWHATGFGRGAEEPERAEHFGMSTVEAMSYGTVPLVYADGGQVEIVTEAVGRLWQTQSELLESTLELARDETLRSQLAGAAAKSSRTFSEEQFRRRVREIMRSLAQKRRRSDWWANDAARTRTELGRLRRLLDTATADLARAQERLAQDEAELRDVQSRARFQLDRYQAELTEVQGRAQAQLDAYQAELTEVHGRAQAQLDEYETQLRAANEALRGLRDNC